ncbi:MAG TPA: LPS export ABC transporter periplasmic protein LptC [Candidatus Aphodousia gallistercoris]|nr:LPS export ABC transporter periplasmic protein LptC [Candidatus Aphodousia gallistercoris]
MRERITAIIAIVLLLILIAASYWYAMQSNYSNLRYVPSEDSPDFIAGGATYVTFGTDGIADTKLQAKELRHYSDDRIRMIEPRATTVSPNEPVTHAEAQKGRSDDGGATFLFEGDVVITRLATGSMPTTKLESQTMRVDTDANRFETDDKVYITSGNDKAEAVGMVFDNLDKTVQLKSQVKTIMVPKNGTDTLLP